MAVNGYVSNYLNDAGRAASRASGLTIDVMHRRKVTGSDLFEYNQAVRNAFDGLHAAISMLNIAEPDEPTVEHEPKTTADYLIAYRDELSTGNIDPDLINGLVRDAARYLIEEVEGFTVRATPKE